MRERKRAERAEKEVAKLTRELEAVRSMPLASLLATASGRPPPPDLVSKCQLRVEGSESVAVECDCRVFASGGVNDAPANVPLLFATSR